FSFLSIRRQPTSTLFPYTTLFRSEIYLRLVLAGSLAFLAVCAVPIAAKWLLIGRWKPQQIRLWSVAYFRFWLVKTLVRSSPAARDRKSTRLNSSHDQNSYAVFCLK